MAHNYLKRLRSEDSYKQFYSLTMKQAAEYTGEPTLPRYRQPPNRIDEVAEPHHFTSPEEYFRSHYFYALDLVDEEISRRSDQSSMFVPKELESLLIKAANLADGSQIDIPEVIQSTYAKDVNMQKAELQLRMLPDLVKAYKESQGLPKLTVTRISTISDIIVNVPIAREMFSEIVRFLRLYLTIPVTTATAERSFSSLRRIKPTFGLL